MIGISRNFERKLKGLLVLLAVFAVLLVGEGIQNSHAYPFIEVDGLVNPGVITPTLDPNISFMTPLYGFHVLTADLGARMNFLSLEFESDVFNNIGTAVAILPADWTTTVVTSSSGNRYEFAGAGTTLGAGDYLIVQVPVLIYNSALTDASLWSEGQIWGQSFFTGDTLHGGDGGSTSPITPVPEPSALLLLGTALLGLGVLGKRYMLKKGGV